MIWGTIGLGNVSRNGLENVSRNGSGNGLAIGLRNGSGNGLLKQFGEWFDERFWE